MIAINTTYQAAPWADLLYACDETWWAHYFPLVATTFAGELWTVAGAARDRHGLRWIMGLDRVGLSLDPTYIHTGMNSGYQALGLAYWLGAQFVTLLGFDFCVSSTGARHWHPDHPGRLAKGTPSRYPAWVRAMDALAADLKTQGVAVVNASRQTALRCFPRVALAEALCR